MVTMPSITPDHRFRNGLMLVLWVWFATVLVVNLPGHLTHDSLTQISEGRSGYVRSWNPIFSSWVFGTLVNWTGGTEVLVAVSASMLAAAFYMILQGLPTQRLWPLIPTAGLLFTPILLIHPGVIWKDVWFAHLSALGFGFIAVRARGSGWWSEAMAIVLLAASSLSRQTGILVATVGVLALTMLQPVSSSAAPARWPAIAKRALGFIVRMALLLLAAQALSGLAKSDMKQIEIGEVGTGFKLVAFFDMAGMLKTDPTLQLTSLRAEGYQTDEWEAAAKATFSAERIDRLDLRPMTGPRDLSVQSVFNQWLTLIAANPLTYAAHRLDVYAWFGGLEDQKLCTPIHVGIDAGPLTPNAGLKLNAPRLSAPVYQWSREFLYTPYFAPLFWSGISLVTCLVLGYARLWRDPVFWLQVAGLTYSASYLIAAFSCDFRYSYFSVVAASIGIIRLCWGDWWPKRPKPDRT